MNIPEVTCKHDADGGHHKQSDPQFAKSSDCRPNSCKNESFTSNTIGNIDVTRVTGKTLNMVEGFISDMLPKSSYLQAPTIVKDSNETTNGNEMGDLKPTAVDENNNDSVEHAITVLEANSILVAHVLEEKEKWFYQWADNYNVGNSDSYSFKKGIEMGGSHTFTGDTDVSTLPKPNITGSQKQKL